MHPLIEYLNQHFDEAISPGSYDDIRRQDLKLLVADGIVMPTNPNAARNNPTRAYCLNPNYASVIAVYATPQWKDAIKTFHEHHLGLVEKLTAQRTIAQTQVILPSGFNLVLSPGEHNRLQKAIVEQFLPRFGYG
jgi:type II restriction enzyme